MEPVTPQPQEQFQVDSTGSPQVPEHKHFLNKKFIVTFVILALLGSGAYAGIWYWQNQQLASEVVPTFTPRPTDETANWKTYTNTQYGFEFKYPIDWLTFEDKTYVLTADTTKSQGSGTCKTKEDILINYYLCPRISFAFKNIQAASFEKLLATPEYSNITDIQDNPWVIKKLGKIGDFDVAQIFNAYLLYSVSAQRGIEMTNNFFPVNDSFTHQILSTFKFIEPIKGTLLIYDPNTTVNELHGKNFKPLTWYLVPKNLKFPGTPSSDTELVFNADSMCVKPKDQFSPALESPCNQKNTANTVRWGYGDRVRVYGKKENNLFVVSRMETVSSLLVEEW